MDFKSYIRVIPDYPQPGIRFKDITTLLKDGPAYKAAIEELTTFAKEVNAEVIAGPEARGFVVGAPLSYALGVGFVPVRKSGKLPYESIKAEYNLEYGKDALAVHVDAIQPGQRVLIADDLLATGGTITSTIQLIEQLGGIVVGAAFFIELSYLDGRQRLGDIPVKTLVQY
ncbi:MULTISPECIES: adenine phosphoribosyltransferase [Brevibacillus]|jgi:adenine phosphoribosyltransferase|uniref:adenine phosphoribosyltransferase n=1 Tax=Brevibacillus TaxID=55080 RepID=UPI00046AECFD|nr:adenine phosphoribosyltransferase [Brevibacillus borstelensis]MBE5394544.1 adenine phosphoribosyltransferase [Brevibacillus borstelensis]MCC0565055.1 adenine phosphoribosyltransferase [Brevibacillus borstelensis]MCM3473241.1 adenine phosphoribosyltransferase [Brevibacillus borstelensis]MCM3561324.1 adenine phosphoribosyltransferase [Brevibacillus borstelensis]MCM3622628.1 adenine phosphoribosyltransferase [Brevibacillus borstelensis]